MYCVLICTSWCWHASACGTVTLQAVYTPQPFPCGVGILVLERHAGALIFPTIYVFDADSGERIEVLELGTILPESGRLSRWLSTMNDTVTPRFNTLGDKVAAEVGALRGARTGAPWAQVQYLPAADQLCLDAFHMMCDRKLVALLPGAGTRQLQLYQAQHMAWERQVCAVGWHLSTFE